MKKNARQWVHCSDIDHGDTFAAARLKPRSCSEKEPAVPRLCVGPSVAACFTAKLFCGPVHVYLTKRCRANRPFDVWDSSLTRERWIVPPCTLHRVAIIPESVVLQCCELARIQVIMEGADGLQARFYALNETIKAFDLWYLRPEIQRPWVSKNDRLICEMLRDLVGRDTA